MPDSARADSRDTSLERVLEDECVRNGRQIRKLRLIVAIGWLINILIGGVGLGRADWLVQLPWVAGYALISIVLFWVQRHDTRDGFLNRWTVACVDLPFVAIVQIETFWASTRRDAVPVFMLALFLVLIIPAPTRRLPRVNFVTTLTAFLLSLAFFPASQFNVDPVWIFAAASLLVVGYLIANHVSRRVLNVARGYARASNLTRYFSPAVAEQIQRGESASNKSESREITVLVSDVRGFTAMSEELPAAEVAAQLDEYLGEMVRLVFAHGGTLDKFMGDGILAYFGAPLAQADHAARAIQCAKDMLQRLDDLNRRRAERGEAPLKIGIGVHSGPAIVGDIGPPERREYTVIGDTVNVTSRIESLTKELGVALCVSSTAQARAHDRFDFVPVGDVKIRGRRGEVALYSIAP